MRSDGPVRDATGEEPPASDGTRTAARRCAHTRSAVRRPSSWWSCHVGQQRCAPSDVLGSASVAAWRLFRIQPKEKRACRGGIEKKGTTNYYAVVHDGVDPGTGRKRRRWVPGGPRRADSEPVLADLIRRKTASLSPPSD